MKTFLKIFGIGVGVFLLILIAAIIIVPKVVDPNDYKDRIVSLVEKQTGRQMTIGGDIEVSVFPWLGVKLHAVELGNAKGFEAPLFAEVKQLQIRVRILPLISRQVEADIIAIRGLTVNLERNKDGQTNWDDLMKTKPEKKPETVEKSTQIAGAMVIGGVSVSDASVTWTDRASGQRLAVRDLSIKTSAVTLVDPVDVKIDFAVDTGDPGIQGKIDTGVRINLDLKDNLYTLDNIQLYADLKGKMLPGGKATIKGDGAVVFNAGTQRLDLSRFKLEAGGLSLPPYTAAANIETRGSGDLVARVFDFPSLKMALTMTAGKERINADLSGKIRVDLTKKKVSISDLALNLPELNKNGMRIKLSAPQRASATLDLAAMTLLIDGMKIAGTVSGKTLPGGSLPVVLGFGVKGDLNKQTVTIDPMQFEALGMKTAGSLAVSKFQTTPEVRGALTIARFNPKDILVRFVKDLPKTADAKALSSAELSVVFSATANNLKIDKLTANIDDSRLTGTAAVSNFQTPDIRFDVSLDRLNVDRYLSPKQTGGKTKTAAAPAAGAAAAAGLPLDTLRKLLIDGKLRILNLTAYGVNITNIIAEIRAKDGIIRTDPMTASLYDGTYNGVVELDARSKDPKIRFEEKLSKVRLDRMLKALAVNTGTMDLSGLSTVNLKGSVVSDTAFKVIRMERLLADAVLGSRLTLGIDGSGTTVNLNDQALTTEALKVTVEDMKLQINSKVTNLFAKPSYKIDIGAPAFNLRQVLAKLGQKLPETADPKAMTVAEVTASVNGSDSTISVESFKLRMDDTRMEGKLSVSSNPTPAYSFDIRVDAMDADRYLPPKKKDSKPVAATPGTAAAAATLPVDTLRTINLDGKLAFGKLKIANLRLEDIQLQATGKDGLLTLNPLSSRLYSGTYKGNVSVDVRGKQPQLAMDEKLTGVQIGPLLKDLRGQTLLNGLTNAGMKFTATGADTDAVSRTLNGKVDFRFTDGSIEKVDIVGKICRALSGLNVRSLKKEDLAAGVLQMISQQAAAGEKPSTNRTEFSEMGGSMVFANGVGTNNDLILKSPLLRVEGTGKLDLPKQRLDYQASVVLVKSCEGQGGKAFRELANYPIPVAINGPLDKLEVKPNLTAGILQILQQNQAKEQPPAAPQQPAQQPLQPQPQDPKKQAEDAVKGLLQKGLQDLLNKQ